MFRLIPSVMAPWVRPWRTSFELGQNQALRFGWTTIVFNLLQWSGYPIAICKITVAERHISDVRTLREDLDVMAVDIEKGAQLGDATCLSDESWKDICWSSLRA